jgi:phosphoribosyl-ATP pyrophosphohydrolase
MSEPTSIFARLMAVIEDRKANPPEKSYTTTLLAGGVPKVGEKVLEEAGEVVEAAGEPGADGLDHTVREAADVIYHLFVLLAVRDIPLARVEEELTRRFGTSGIDE